MNSDDCKANEDRDWVWHPLGFAVLRVLPIVVGRRLSNCVQ